MSCRNAYAQDIMDVHHMSKAKFAHIRNRWSCCECGKWFRYRCREWREEKKDNDCMDPWIGRGSDMCRKCIRKINLSPIWTWSMKDLPL